MTHLITITGKNEILRHILKASTLDEAKVKARQLWQCLKKPVSLIITDEESKVIFEHLNRKNGDD